MKTEFSYQNVYSNISHFEQARHSQNKKQNSKAAIASYYGKQGNIQNAMETINSITKAVIEATTLKEFGFALQNHEIELSNILELPTVKEALFPDFDGVLFLHDNTVINTRSGIISFIFFYYPESVIEF